MPVEFRLIISKKIRILLELMRNASHVRGYDVSSFCQIVIRDSNGILHDGDHVNQEHRIDIPLNRYGSKKRENDGWEKSRQAENARDLEMKAGSCGLTLPRFTKLDDLEPDNADNRKDKR